MQLLTDKMQADLKYSVVWIHLDTILFCVDTSLETRISFSAIPSGYKVHST